MFATRLLIRLGLGLSLAMTPLSAQAASGCMKVLKRIPGKPLRIPPGYRVISKAKAQALPPCACSRGAKASLPVPRPAPSVAARPLPPSSAPSGGSSFKPAIPPSGPSYNVHGDAPDGSIANSQQRQAIAIGVVAVAVGAAIWMASREHAAQAKAEAEAGPDAPAAAPHFDDPADAHDYAVQMALAKARKP